MRDERGTAGEAARHFADALKADLLTRFDLGYGELSRRVAAGLSASDLSRFAAGTKVPTFEHLDALLAFAGKEYGHPLPAEPTRELRARHLQAVRECSPAAYDLYMAVEEVRAWRGRYSRNEGATALTATKWHRAVLAREQAAEQLRRSESAADREDAAADRDRALEAAQSERAAVQAENVRVSTQLLAVRENLRAQIDQLEVEVARLFAELEESQEQQHDAWEQGALLAKQLAAAEQRVHEEQQRGDRLEDEVRLLNEMRQNSLREREVHQAEQEARLREHQVLADAQAAVDAARRLETAAPRALSATGAAAGTGRGPHTAKGAGPRKATGTGRGPRTATGAGAGTGPRTATATDPDPAAAAQDGRPADDALATVVLVGTPAEVAEAVRRLVEQSEPERVREALALSAERPGAEVAALVQALEEVGCYPQKEQLLIEAARQPAVMVTAAVRALHEADRAAEIGWLLEAAAKAAPQDVTSLTLELLDGDMRADAGRLLDAAAPRRSAHEVADLVVVLYDAGWTGEAERLVKDASVRRSGREIVELLRTLQVSAAAPLAERVTAVVADRAPSALAATVRALVDAGETEVVRGVLRVAAGRPAAEVAKAAGALADVRCAGLGVWLIQVRVAGIEDADALPDLLARLAADGRTDLLHRVVGDTARHCPVSEIPLTLDGLRESADGAYSTAVREVSLRPWQDVLAVVAALSASAALDDEQAAASADVLREFVRRPVEDVVPLLDQWLDAVAEDVAATLPSLAVAAGLALGHHLELAAALREAGRHTESAELLRAVGERQTIVPDAVCGVLDLGVHGVGVRQLLNGWANRPAGEVAPLVELLLTTEHEAVAWFVLDRFVPGADTASLALVWTRLSLAGQPDAVERLVDLIVEAVEYAVVAGLVTRPPVAGADTALLLRVAAHSEPADVAAQLTALAAERNWAAVSFILHRVAKGPRGRARAVATKLSAAGRPRQAAWLGAQADRPGRRGDVPAPGGENPQEAVDRALSTPGDDPAGRLGAVLEAARFFSTRELLTLLGRLRAEPDLRELATHVCEESAETVPGLRPQSVEDTADLAEMLRATLKLTEQADATLWRALVALPTHDISLLMDALHVRGRRDDLARLRAWAPLRLAAPDLTALARDVKMFDPGTSRSMIWSALRSDADPQDLRALVDFAVDSRLGTVTEVMNLVAEHRTPEQLAALLNELPSGYQQRMRITDAVPEDTRPASGHETHLSDPDWRPITDTAAPDDARPVPTDELPRPATESTSNERRLFELWSTHLRNHPLLRSDTALRSWVEGCLDRSRLPEAHQALHTALLRIPLAKAAEMAAELAALRGQAPAVPWSIPLESGDVVQLSTPNLAEHGAGGTKRRKGPGMDRRLSAATGDALWLMSTDRTLMIARPNGEMTPVTPDNPDPGGRNAFSDQLRDLARAVTDVRGPALTAHQVQAYGTLDLALGSLVHTPAADPGSWWGRRRLTLLRLLQTLTEPSGAVIGYDDPSDWRPGPRRLLWVVAPVIVHPGYRAPGRYIESAPRGPRVRTVELPPR